MSETTGGCGCGGCGCGGGGQATTERPGLPIVAAAPRSGAAAVPGDLDARALPPAERHARILATATALLPGEAFVIANDHDPARLRTELAEIPGELGWEYLAAGPDLWRVRISRTTCC